MNLIETIIGSVKKRSPQDQNAAAVEAPDTSESHFHKLVAGFDTLIGVDRVPILTYEEAIKRLVRDKPTTRRTLRGALLLANAGFGDSLVTWLYLDQDGLPVVDGEGRTLGRRLIASCLDDELAECFSGGDILILE